MLKMMIEKIKQLIESHNALAKAALTQYQPIVRQYIAENCQESNEIGYTLDFMLDFCFDEKMLLLYRQLCQHLYSFDQEAAFYYANAYREMWDEEGTQFGQGIRGSVK
jgi:hypothetical protein